MNDRETFPRLRDGATLHPFSTSAREDSYLLCLTDGRSLEVSREVRNLLVLMDGSRNLEAIAADLAGDDERRLTAEDVHHWVETYLRPLRLLGHEPDAGRSEPTTRQAASRPPHGISLVPAHRLLPFTRRLKHLFRPAAALPLLWAVATAHALFYNALFTNAAGLPPSVSGIPTLAAAYLALIASVLFHELGHLSACLHFGCPHGEVRFGLYLLFPVFYANVTPAWRLDRRHRLVVDLGGVYFQLLLTVPFLLLLHVTGNPVWGLLILEIDSLVLFSLNPFLRFDGYWICSDLLGVPNLRRRSLRLLHALALRALGRPWMPASPLTDIRTVERVGLVLYAAGSCAFFCLIAVILVRILPDQLQALCAQVVGAVRTGTPAALWERPGAMAGLLARLLGLLVLARMLWRGVRAGLALARHTFRGR